MTAQKILEVFVSDIIIALIISGMMNFISSKKGKENEKALEKSIEEIKDHLDLRLEQTKLEIEKTILQQKKNP